MATPASETLKLTQEQLREYLYPPGDSIKYQAAIDNAFKHMRDGAIADGRIKTVIFQMSQNRNPPINVVSTLTWTNQQAQKYVDPALGAIGDMQTELDVPLVQMYNEAVADQSSIKQVEVDILPP